jgi:hypothetical protein
VTFQALGIEQFPKLQKELVKKFRRVEGDLNKVAKETAIALASLAKSGISKGGRSGHLYEWEVDLPGRAGDEPSSGFLGFWKAPHGRYLPIKKRNKPHKASAPGEYPKTDKGALVNSIMWQTIAGGAEVGTDLDYGLFLEEGTRFMEARPWLAPTTEKVAPDYAERLMSLIRRNL